MTKIDIPTADELSDRLNGLERLLTARRWERAAIVWAFTTADNGRPAGNPSEVRGFPIPLGAFARLRFAGLTSEQTVRKYRANWKAAIDAGKASEVAPGDTDIELPDMDWPGTTEIADNPMRARKEDAPERKVDVVRNILASDPKAAKVFDEKRQEEMHQRTAEAAAKRADEMRASVGKEKTQDSWDPLATPEQQQARKERLTQNDPIARRFEQEEYASNLITVLEKIASANRKHIEQIHDCLRGMGDGGVGPFAEFGGFREYLMDAHKATDQLKAKLDEVDDYRATGRTDLDAGLDEILKNGK